MFTKTTPNTCIQILYCFKYNAIRSQHCSAEESLPFRQSDTTYNCVFQPPFYFKLFKQSFMACKNMYFKFKRKFKKIVKVW